MIGLTAGLVIEGKTGNSIMAQVWSSIYFYMSIRKTMKVVFFFFLLNYGSGFGYV